MKAFIFAAGLGTRLKPWTDTMPKALVPYSGRPMMGHLIDRLKDAGVGEIVVNVLHFAQQIVSYFRSEDDFGIKVQISDESDALLDTGGGLLHARAFLEGGTEPFIAHNVDILSNLDIRAFYDSGTGDNAVAKLLVSDRDSSRKLLFDKDMRLMGWKNLKTGQTKGRPESAVFEYAFAGVHLLSPSILYKVFDSCPQFAGAFSIIDSYLDICCTHVIYGYLQNGLRVLDIGKPEALAMAEKFR